MGIVNMCMKHTENVQRAREHIQRHQRLQIADKFCTSKMVWTEKFTPQQAEPSDIYVLRSIYGITITLPAHTAHTQCCLYITEKLSVRFAY